MATATLTVKLREPFEAQVPFKQSKAKRKLLKCGRRGGKTTIATDDALEGVDGFLDGGRVLYAAPTQEQTDKFWFETTTALYEPLEAGIYKINYTRRIIERPGTENRLKAKTAWDANSLRGDFGSKVILDEYQQMKPEILARVVYPMLLDTDGCLTVIYTPYDEDEKGTHARDLYDEAEQKMNEALEIGETPRWEVFSWTSLDNPHLDRTALDEISEDMDELAYRQEILAEHLKETPGALWSHAMIAKHRVKVAPDLGYVVVAVDPPASIGRCGLVVAGRKQMDDGKMHAFVIADHTLRGKPGVWGRRVVTVYNLHQADRVIAEVNNGGDMVENTVRVSLGGEDLPFKQIRASRGKALRAEPVAALYAEGRVHHVGIFEELEKQQTNWVPGKGQSPDNLDSAVYAVTNLLLGPRGWSKGIAA